MFNRRIGESTPTVTPMFTVPANKVYVIGDITWGGEANTINLYLNGNLIFSHNSSENYNKDIKGSVMIAGDVLSIKNNSGNIPVWLSREEIDV